jgi:predicted nucleotidyltransferase
LETAQETNIRTLALFGSALRDDCGPESDIDVLVEFEPGHVPGLAFFAMEEELSGILGRKVDLNTPGSLTPYFRNEVLSEAEVLYAAVPELQRAVEAAEQDLAAGRWVEHSDIEAKLRRWAADEP